MKPFLRWEIELFIKYLHEIPFDVARVSLSFKAMVDLQIDLKVDEFRVNIAGVQPHPDNGAGANRGAALIHAADNPQSGDDTIPAGLLQTYRNSIVSANAALEFGQLTDAQLQARYPELWAATTAP